MKERKKETDQMTSNTENISLTSTYTLTHTHIQKKKNGNQKNKTKIQSQELWIKEFQWIAAENIMQNQF